MADHPARRGERDGGFTLIEMLITIVVSGIIAGVLGTAVNVVMRNDRPTQERFNGANDSLTITTMFPADIAATPPGGREIGSLTSGCAGSGVNRGTNVLRLTWTESTGGNTTSYRVSYRLDAAEKQLLRVACIGSSGLYAPGSVRVLGTLVSGASLAYTSLDAEDITLVLNVAATPPSSHTHIRGVRSNPAATLPPPPVVASKSAIRLLTTTEALQYTTIGSQISFSTVVLNAGTTVLTSVGISDAAADTGSIACGTTELTPGATTNCTFTHTISQVDINNGSVVSLTTGTGTPPSGAPVTNVSGTVTVPGVQAAQLTVTKSTTATNYKLAGEILSYTATVRNSGNLTLNSLSLTDPKSNGTISCSATTLDPLATATCSYQYTVKAADLVVGGTIASAATATATRVSGGNVSATSNSVSVPFLASPAITGTMVADRSSFNLPGQVINYTTTVTNTGNVSLSSISVSHTNATSPSCSATVLAAGASTTCTARHVVTLGDTLALSVRNQGTVTGVPASGGGAITASTNEVMVSVIDGLALTVTKVFDASPSVYRQIGEVLQYTITVRNTGSQILSNLTITDPMNDGSSTVCSSPVTLAINATRTCTARHTVTAAELGSPIVNTAACACSERAWAADGGHRLQHRHGQLLADSATRCDDDFESDADVHHARRGHQLHDDGHEYRQRAADRRGRDEPDPRRGEHTQLRVIDSRHRGLDHVYVRLYDEFGRCHGLSVEPGDRQRDVRLDSGDGVVVDGDGQLHGALLGHRHDGQPDDRDTTAERPTEPARARHGIDDGRVLHVADALLPEQLASRCDRRHVRFGGHVDVHSSPPGFQGVEVGRRPGTRRRPPVDGDDTRQHLHLLPVHGDLRWSSTRQSTTSATKARCSSWHSSWFSCSASSSDLSPRMRPSASSTPPACVRRRR